MENQFCVLENDQCPINIKDIINSLNNNSLHINDNNNEQILSVFKLSENIPCIHPSENTWNYYYVLEPKSKKCTTKIKRRTNDERYKKIDRISSTKYDLYRNNSIRNYNEEKTRNEMVYLYARNLIGIKSNKMKKYELDGLDSQQKLSNNCGKAMFIISCILLGFISLPILVVVGMAVKDDDDGNKIDCEKDGPCLWEFYIYGTIILSTLSLLIDFILCVIIFISSLKIRSKLDIKGSDAFTNELFQKIIDDYDINYKFSRANTIILGIISVLCLLLLINFVNNCRKRDRIQEEILKL